MKPATAPINGEILEKTTRTRVIPANSESRTPELWDYLAAVDSAREWDKHTVYLHRMDPSGPDGTGVPVWKGVQYLGLPDGTQVPLHDREEVEFAILKHYGGKTFRIMVKRGAQLITKGIIFVDAAPRQILPPSAQSSPTGAPIPQNGDAVAFIAGKSIDTIAGHEHQAVNLGLGMMSTAANVIRSFAEGRPGAVPSQSDQMMQQFMAAMIARMSMDPIQQMVQMLAVIKELNGAMGNAAPGVGNVTEKILTVAVDRMLNPAPSGAPVSAIAEAVRMAPQVIAGLADTVREQRLMRETELRIAQTNVRTMPAPNPQVIPPAPPNQAPPMQPPAGAPTMDFVFKKVVEIFNQPISASQAADEAMSFLDNLDQNAIGQLASLGEEGLLKLFGTTPALAPATHNMPRLVEFIRAFLKMHDDDVKAAESGAQAPPAPGTPPLPN